MSLCVLDVCGGGRGSIPPPHTSRYSNNLCKDDSALFPKFLHGFTQDLGRYVASVGLGWYLPHAPAGVEGRVVVNAELGLLGLFLQQLEVEREKIENIFCHALPRIIL